MLRLHPLTLSGAHSAADAQEFFSICFVTLLEMWKVNYVCSAFSLDEAHISICKRISAGTVMSPLKQTKRNSECYHCLSCFPTNLYFHPPKSMIKKFYSELTPISVSVILGYDCWVSPLFLRKVFVWQYGLKFNTQLDLLYFHGNKGVPLPSRTFLTWFE